jgi:hypothetical protein
MTNVEWISIDDFLARRKRVEKFERQMNLELAQIVKELRAKGIMENTNDEFRRSY